MAGDKIRLRFAKTGPVRLISHHDLMRCAERMLRRAALPFRVTQGFHPTPRLVFALSCPLGVDALREVVELELQTPHEAADVLARLNAQAPAGLMFHAAAEVPLKATAVARRAVYSVVLPPGRAAEVRNRAAELLVQEKVWVERQHPNPRRLNLRPFVRAITVTDAATFDLWVTGHGTARGDELVRLLHLTDVVDAGAVLTRVDLEIHDEVPAGDPADVPPVGPPEVLPPDPLTHPSGTVPAGDANDAARATWGLSPAGPAVE